MSDTVGTGDGLMPATYQTAGPTHVDPPAITPDDVDTALVLSPALDIVDMLTPAPPLHHFCECGCGVPVLRRYSPGHNLRAPRNTEPGARP